jgi:hypothetical protein
VLTPGEYPDLHNSGPQYFSDIMSSVKFNQGVPAAPPVKSIPVVAELYSGADFTGRKLIIFENVADLATYSSFANSTQSAKVFRGPNYGPGSKVRFHEKAQFEGSSLDLAPGEYPNLKTGTPKMGFDVYSVQLVNVPR